MTSASRQLLSACGALACLVALAGCDRVPPSVESASAQEAPAPGEREVRAVLDHWLDAVLRTDTAAVATLFAPYATTWNAGDPDEWNSALRGRAAIASEIVDNAKFYERGALSGRKTRVIGNLAVETGTFASDGDPRPDHVIMVSTDYIAVLARRPDGTWRIQSMSYGNPVEHAQAAVAAPPEPLADGSAGQAIEPPSPAPAPSPARESPPAPAREPSAAPAPEQASAPAPQTAGGPPSGLWSCYNYQPSAGFGAYWGQFQLDPSRTYEHLGVSRGQYRRANGTIAFTSGDLAPIYDVKYPTGPDHDLLDLVGKGEMQGIFVRCSVKR